MSQNEDPFGGLGEPDDLPPLMSITRDDGLTDDEGRVHDAACEVVNEFAKLPVQHPDDMRAIVDAVHVVQQILCMRIAQRHYPKGWPIK